MIPIALFAAGLGSPTDALVNEVVIGHRSTLGLIRTFSAVVSFADTESSDLAKSARYLRDAERVSIQRGASDHQQTCLVIESGRIRQVSRNWIGRGGQKLGQPQVVACVWSPTEHLGGLDAWRELVLSFQTGAGSTDHLGVAVGLRGADPSARRETVDGRPLIRLSYTYHLTPEFAMRSTLWHDPARGYLVVRRDLAAVDGSRPGSRLDVTDFVSAGGITVPTKATLNPEPEPDGRPASAQTTTLTEVQVNRPLPAGVLDLPLPAGTTVTDDVRKTKYVAGPDWRPTGSEKPWSRTAVVAPAALAGAPTRQSTEEPRSWMWWLMAASGAVLALGGAATLVRRTVRGRNGLSA